MNDPTARNHPAPDPRSSEAETLHSQLFDQSPLPAVLSRLEDDAVIALSASAAAVIGIPQHEAVGRPFSDYYQDASERVALDQRLRRDRRADEYRVRIRRASGEPFWALASSRMIDWRGTAAILTVFHDISEQVAAETSLDTSERRLAAQSDALTSLTARYTNPEERLDERLRSILEMSARALNVARLSIWRFESGRSSITCAGLFEPAGSRYVSGGSLRRADAPAYFEALESERAIAAADARSDPRTREFLQAYLVPNDIGAMLDVPLRHDNATVGVLCAEHVGGTRAWTVDEQSFMMAVASLAVVAIAEEERRDALQRVAESENRARLIVDTAHDAFIGIDSAGAIVSWNTQAEATFGWTREEALGRNLAETIIPPAFREAHNNGMRRFHETGDAPVVNQRLELTAVHRTGSEFPVELTITAPLREERGYFFGAFLRDISDRRERDAELRRAKESAESATRAKSEFLANMSHELRTPLNGVIGYAQLLQRDKTLSPAQHEAVEAISQCGSQLLDLINDVLDLAKIEAGRLDIVEGPLDLSKLVSDIRYIFAEAAERKGLRLTMTVDPELPRWVVLDNRHLRQVLLNLLGNAIKFTAEGDVGLVVSRDDAQVRFDVVDTGPGIEPEGLTQIFEAFAQTEAGAAAGGTGLGLTISDHLIRKMGGRLNVDSEVGAGSRFWFTLPLVPGREPASSPDRHVEFAVPTLDARLPPGERLTALVADDSTANRRILASLLESAGIEVITASGGLEAIELARMHRPNVVFMDLRMEDLHGLEATRRLARDPATAAIPVIAVTASAFGRVHQTAREAGCIDCLSKPIRAQLLFGVLQKHLGIRFISDSTDQAPHAESTIDLERRTEMRRRLRNALALGDVADIQELAQALMKGTPAEAAMGERIGRLATNFDFEALGELAESLMTT